MTLTYQQAFLAAYTLLDDLYDNTKDNTLVQLLWDMDPFVFTDRSPADPAIWADWISCAGAIQKEGLLTEDNAYQVFIDFLRMDAQEYGYDMEAVLHEIQASWYQKRWKELLEKASRLPDV